MLGVASVLLALEADDDRRPSIRLTATQEPIVVRVLRIAGSRKENIAVGQVVSAEIIHGCRNRSDGCGAVSGWGDVSEIRNTSISNVKRPALLDSVDHWTVHRIQAPDVYASDDHTLPILSSVHIRCILG